MDPQPHRTRYRKTARPDAEFKQRAEKVLGCYADAVRLARRGYRAVCVDEKPNRQVLERHPIRRAVPGRIEQREFEHTRHGTVNILAFLIVPSGRMEAACVEVKDAGHYVGELARFRRRHRHLRGAYLIRDGDRSCSSMPSPTANVQPAVRPPVRVYVDEPEDEAVVRRS